MKATIGYPRAGILDAFGNLRYKFTQHHALYMYARYRNEYPGDNPLVSRIWNGLKSMHHDDDDDDNDDIKKSMSSNSKYPLKSMHHEDDDDYNDDDDDNTENSTSSNSKYCLKSVHHDDDDDDDDDIKNNMTSDSKYPPKSIHHDGDYNDNDNDIEKSMSSKNYPISTLELLNKTAVALYLCYGPEIYDQFVRDIIEWTTTTTNTIIAGATPDVLIQIVRSGAKGSLEHLVEMERLKECNDLDDYISRSYSYLANFIHSSQELPQQGHLFYRYNAILNGLYCDEHGNLCLDGRVMIRKFCDNIPTQLSVDTDILKLCLFDHITGSEGNRR
jgi:hypothetical protein